MAEIGHCKAFYVKDFRALPGWEENLGNLRPEIREEKDGDVEVPRTELGDDDYLFLHESYVVTDGIYMDEHIIFDQVTDEWRAACRSQLPGGFEIPVYEPIEIRTAEEATEPDAEAGEEETAG